MPNDEEEDDDDEGLEDEDEESLSDHKDSDTEDDSEEIPEVSCGTSSLLKHSQFFICLQSGRPPCRCLKSPHRSLAPAVDLSNQDHQKSALASQSRIQTRWASSPMKI